MVDTNANACLGGMQSGGQVSAMMLLVNLLPVESCMLCDTNVLEVGKPTDSSFGVLAVEETRGLQLAVVARRGLHLQFPHSGFHFGARYCGYMIRFFQQPGEAA